MHDHGVHPGRHEEGVQDVGLELGALGDGAGHNGARRGRELRGSSGTGDSRCTSCDVWQRPASAATRHSAWPGHKAVQSWEVAHRPLEEEQVVLVVGEVVPQRKVPRADESVVVGHCAAQERVGTWLVRRRGLVTKRNRICSESKRPSLVCLYSCLHAQQALELDAVACERLQRHNAGPHIRISRRRFRKYTRPPG